MYIFVTEMCTFVRISIRKWCIVEYMSDAFCDLWNSAIFGCTSDRYGTDGNMIYCLLMYVVSANDTPKRLCPIIFNFPHSLREKLYVYPHRINGFLTMFWQKKHSRKYVRFWIFLTSDVSPGYCVSCDCLPKGCMSCTKDAYVRLLCWNNEYRN